MTDTEVRGHLNLHAIHTSLLDTATAASPSGERLVLPAGAELFYFPHFYSAADSDCYFQQLLQHTPWQQDHLNIGGRKVAVPRLQAWYGDPHACYGYSGLRLHPLPWTPQLLTIRADIERQLQLPFNSVLLNYYRDGADSVAWHSDDEKELGADPIIASLSFGATRRFELKHRTRRDVAKLGLDLQDGSLILMGKGVQKHWVHCIPKQSGVAHARLNLTFRFIPAVA